MSSAGDSKGPIGFAQLRSTPACGHSLTGTAVCKLVSEAASQDSEANPTETADPTQPGDDKCASTCLRSCETGGITN